MRRFTKDRCFLSAFFVLVCTVEKHQRAFLVKVYGRNRGPLYFCLLARVGPNVVCFNLKLIAAEEGYYPPTMSSFWKC